MLKLTAAALVASIAVPGLAAAAEGSFPRLVERGDQVCLQALDEDGQIVESCQSKDPVPAKDYRRASHLPAHLQHVPPDAAESLSWAAVKYSWSGPLKWGAVTGGVVGAAAFLSGIANEDEGLRDLGAYVLLGAGINLVLGLIIDGSAADDVEDARRMMAR